MSGLDDTLRDERAGMRRMVGPYRIEGLLGRGSIGIVCRATAPDGRAVAVKMLLDVMLAGDELVERFRREAEVRIDHPNVVRVLDTGSADDGAAYIVLELLEGETVEARWAKGAVPPDEVVDVGLQVTQGLAAAHAQAIVHRDLKPANLFRCADGTIKILDFGVAFARSYASRLTRLGAVIGTPSYLSPEQASGRADIDERTDVWALGALLYQGLTGTPPFDRDSPLATIVAVVRDPLPALSPLGIEPSLARTIERALAKRPQDRWPSAAAFGEALRGLDRSTLGRSRMLAASAGPAPTDENRVVAVMLAEGATDGAALRMAIEERGGAFLSLVGERVLGIFGSETWVGDEGQRAVEAALAARGAARHVAVASGRARRSDAGITGAVLAEVERGCRAALEGVAIDEETRRALPSDFGVQVVGEGVAEVVERRSLPPSQLGDDFVLPLIGRDAERAQLDRAVQTVTETGCPTSLLILGPPGIGKSRLRHELERQLRAGREPFTILSAQSLPHRRPIALSTLASALEPLVRDTPSGGALHPGGVAPIEGLGQLAGLGGGDAAAIAERTAFLGELLGLPVMELPALVAARGNPQQMADRLHIALHEVLEGLASQGPVALLLDNAQWADHASLELVLELPERLGDRPLLIVACARPELLELEPVLTASPSLLRLELRGLLGEEVVTLAAAAAGRALPKELSSAIAERTLGNPLFVEQIARDLAEAAPVGAQGGPLETLSGPLPLPLTVEAAVQSRLDALPPVEKELAKRAALLRHPFTAQDLAALGVSASQELLLSLVRKDLLSGQSRASGVRRYQFKSALVAEVAERMLADEVRADLHRRAARLLAQTEPLNPEEVARHHEEGGEAALAAGRFGQAAQAALVRADAAAVLRCADKALALGLPAENRFAIHMARQEVLRFLARRDEQGRALDLATAAAASDGERARAYSERASWFAATGQIVAAIEAARAAVASAEAARAPEVLARALVRLGSSLLRSGEVASAREALARARAASADQSAAVRAFVLEWEGHLAAAVGDLGARLQSFREAEALYREVGDIRRAAGAESNLADAYNRVGAYAEAERALRAAALDCRRVGNRMMEGYALLNRGFSLSMLGRSDEALAVLGEAEGFARVGHDARLEVAARVYAARAGASCTAESLERLAAEAERLHLPSVTAMALVLSAAARRASGQSELATVATARAVGIVDDQGGLEEGEVEVLLAHAEDLEASGQAEEAVSMRTRARERVRAVAAGIDDPALRQAFLANIPAHRSLLEG